MLCEYIRYKNIRKSEIRKIININDIDIKKLNISERFIGNEELRD